MLKILLLEETTPEVFASFILPITYRALMLIMLLLSSKLPSACIHHWLTYLGPTWSCWQHLWAHHKMNILFYSEPCFTIESQLSSDVMSSEPIVKCGFTVIKNNTIAEVEQEFLASLFLCCSLQGVYQKTTVEPFLWYFDQWWAVYVKSVAGHYFRPIKPPKLRLPLPLQPFLSPARELTFAQSLCGAQNVPKKMKFLEVTFFFPYKAFGGPGMLQEERAPESFV